jgi:helicase
MMFYPKENIDINIVDKDPLINLCIDTLSKSKQALIFASSKKSAEKTAEDIAKKIKVTNNEWLDISKKALGSLSSPTKQCKRLAFCLEKGIAFHHSGLTSKQREIVEESFKEGIIQIIASTPTLAAGLDLPAYRAIIKDLKRFGNRGMTYIPVLEYLQMAGRAGRPKYDSIGEAICIASTESQEEQIVENYIFGEPEDIYSKLAVEPVLRTYLLSLISSGLVKTKLHILKFFEKTFWAHQFKDMIRMEMIIDQMLVLLEKWEFIKSNENNNSFVSASDILVNYSENICFFPTPIGKRVSELYLDPLTAHEIIKGIRRSSSRKNVNLFSYLHLLCSTIEMHPLLRVLKRDYSIVEEKLMRYSSFLLVDEPSQYDYEYQHFLDSIKTAVCLEEWMNEITEDALLDSYSLTPGGLRAKLEKIDWLIYSAIELARLQVHKDSISDLNKLRLRLKHGVKEEILPLLRFKNIGRSRARKLFKNKICNVQDIKNVDVSILSHLIGKNIAISLKKEVGIEVDKIEIKPNKRKGQINLNDFS